MDFEGARIRIEDKSVFYSDLAPGDLYIGERNIGPQLLTCKYVDREKRLVMPVEFPAYPYGTCECHKVLEIL